MPLDLLPPAFLDLLTPHEAILGCDRSFLFPWLRLAFEDEKKGDALFLMFAIFSKVFKLLLKMHANSWKL